MIDPVQCVGRRRLLLSQGDSGIMELNIRLGDRVSLATLQLTPPEAAKLEGQLRWFRKLRQAAEASQQGGRT